MARLSAKLVGAKQLEKRIADLNPEQNKRIVAPALRESMLLALRIAARDKILAGGQGPPRPNILTSRTGALRRSLGASTGLDVSGLPRFIEGGTALIYGRVHEFGSGTHPPRPFLEPALADASKEFESIFVKHWKRAAEI